jgi:5-methylcytosine-specific restriction endonuclease McrA
MDRSEAGKKGYEKTKHILQKQRDEKSRETRENYEDRPKFCLFCRTQIPYEGRRGKFCNKSCAASYNNAGVNRHADHLSELPSCSCGKPRRRQNKYCDDCIEKRVYNKYLTLEETRDDRVRKRIIVEERGNQCQVCGIVDWMGKPIKLELDHIDGNTDNNLRENLRLICPNCHSQTETYKGANTGKNSSRQKMRRKRYAKGQTY